MFFGDLITYTSSLTGKMWISDKASYAVYNAVGVSLILKMSIFNCLIVLFHWQFSFELVLCNPLQYKEIGSLYYSLIMLQLLIYEMTVLKVYF